MHFVLSAFLIGLTASAAQADPPAPAESAPAATVYIGAVSTTDEEAQLSRLIAESFRILRSDRFAANLLSMRTTYPTVYANPDWPAVPPERVVRIIRLQEPDTHYVRVPAALVGSQAYRDPTFLNYTARTGPIHWDGTGLPSAMSIGRVNMFRYAQTDDVDRSCAINTMAHEIIHTISRTPGAYVFAFTDTGIADRADKTAPLASYLIGSVAQCTYLQEIGRVPAEGLAACVAVFGTRNFNNARCNRFTNGEAVEERPDLPAPADPL